MAPTVKITRKGQLTIPRKIREKLATDVVECDWADGVATLRPVRSVAGSLRRFSGKRVNFEEEREQAWQEVAHECPGNKTD